VVLIATVDYAPTGCCVGEESVAASRRPRSPDCALEAHSAVNWANCSARRALGGRARGEQAGQQIEPHVAVAPLAERAGERLDVGERAGAALAVQARFEDLERRAQTAARHPHRVDALDVAEVEDGLAAVREHGLRAL